MKRGIEVGIFLRPGLDDEEFVATALGNLAAWQLAQDRHEPLEWQVLRVETTNAHHYRLVIRHPDRVFDLGARPNLGHLLDALSREDVATLRRRYSDAQREGLKPTPLHRVREEVDFWQDDFWNWLG